MPPLASGSAFHPKGLRYENLLLASRTPCKRECLVGAVPLASGRHALL